MNQSTCTTICPATGAPTGIAIPLKGVHACCKLMLSSLINKITAGFFGLVVATTTVVAAPTISEFMAANSSTLADDDGAFSDWIEIFNPETGPVNLAGWYLTDTATSKTKWQFPSVTIPSGGYLVVFASGKNRRDPNRPLHTNFSLSSGGEYLGLVRPDGNTVATDFAPTFPTQYSDISFGVTQPTDGSPGAIGYLRTATPGSNNGGISALMLVEKVAFSRPATTYSESFSLSLSGASPGQTYSLRGRPPLHQRRRCSFPHSLVPTLLPADHDQLVSGRSRRCFLGRRLHPRTRFHDPVRKNRSRSYRLRRPTSRAGARQPRPRRTGQR